MPVDLSNQTIYTFLLHSSDNEVRAVFCPAVSNVVAAMVQSLPGYFTHTNNNWWECPEPGRTTIQVFLNDHGIDTTWPPANSNAVEIAYPFEPPADGDPSSLDRTMVAIRGGAVGNYYVCSFRVRGNIPLRRLDRVYRPETAEWFVCLGMRQWIVEGLGPINEYVVVMESSWTNPVYEGELFVFFPPAGVVFGSVGATLPPPPPPPGP